MEVEIRAEWREIPEGVQEAAAELTEPDEDGPPLDVPLGGAMPYDVIVGPFNPIALPVVLDFEPPRALGRAVFNTREGVERMAASRRRTFDAANRSPAGADADNNAD